MYSLMTFIADISLQLHDLAVLLSLVYGYWSNPT